MRWYLEVLKKYSVFEGRATREEFWMFHLFHTLITLGFRNIDNFAGLNETTEGLNPLTLLYGLAMLMPFVAVFIRRLHDTNRSGWWFLIIFVPLFGFLLLYWLVKDSDSGNNRYGSNPKAKTKT